MIDNDKTKSTTKTIRLPRAGSVPDPVQVVTGEYERHSILMERLRQSEMGEEAKASSAEE